MWVSDNGPIGFSGPTANSFDDAFITNLLWSAGHNVIRYNQDNANNNLMTQADIDALNTNDLIIVGRSQASGEFANQRGTSWNQSVTKPVIISSPFLTRAAQLGWFSGGGNANTGSPTALGLLDPSNVRTAYLFDGVELNGTNTVQAYDEAMDQNTSITPDTTQGGGVIYARTLNAVIGVAIADWPAGAVLRSGTNTLAGYRMFLAAGSREVANTAVSNAGKETLSPMGEQVFLRAVLLAANNGVPPNIVYDPIIIQNEPVSVTNAENTVASFSVTLAQGNFARFQWYSNDVPVPGARTAILLGFRDTFGRHELSTSSSRTMLVSVVTSIVATLTVIADTNPPVVLGARALSERSVAVYFNEPVDPATAIELQRDITSIRLTSCSSRTARS